ncbi:MAG: hypothetical protein PVG59_21635, partial [Desulfobacterales bacterium]
KKLSYTACHNNVPKKGWRHKCCSKKTFRNRNVFLTTTIKPQPGGSVFDKPDKIVNDIDSKRLKMERCQWQIC